jgi:hypothetical protein
MYSNRMSMTYTAIEDQLISLIDTLSSEPNAIERLRTIKRIEELAMRMLRRIKTEAAYDARMRANSGDIADAVEMDRKAIDYLVRVYLVNNPSKPRPRTRQPSDVSSFLDLSGEPSLPKPQSVN